MMTAETVARELDALALQIRSVAARLEVVDDICARDQRRAGAKAEEMFGAADMAREWAKDLRRAQRAKTKGGE